ncbi:MAG TPA: hypothetical protein VFP12_18370 [Allosphingosinicella sp.]|nr:hypothetical protein [Allosphingosinicella sp.]
MQLPCCKAVGERQAFDLSTGTAPWRVNVPTSPSFATAVPASDPAWAPVNGADWIGPPGGWDAEGDYTYEVRFEVPRCPVGRDITVSGNFAADNRAAIFVGPSTTPVAVSQGTFDYGFLPGSITPFSATFPSAGAGTYVLKAVVNNSGGVTGLAVQATVASVCRTAS